MGLQASPAYTQSSVLQLAAAPDRAGSPRSSPPATRVQQGQARWRNDLHLGGRNQGDKGKVRSRQHQELHHSAFWERKLTGRRLSCRARREKDSACT